MYLLNYLIGCNVYCEEKKGGINMKKYISPKAVKVELPAALVVENG
ncbi:hypothetical protein ACQVQ5_29215 [Bacillus mycoides]